jgi:Mrp family chromosome partitioning ATPase/capsular polysaccharide biosynthesis protein
MSSDTDLDRSALAHYAAIVWRRKLVVIAAIIIVPVVALAIGLRQGKLYAATSDVLLNRQSLVDAVSGAQGIADTQPGDLARDAQTQADIAMSPNVAALAISKAGLSSVESPADLLGAASVTPDPSADILYFKVENADPSRAVALASAFGAAYVAYRQQLDTASLRVAEQGVQRQIAQLGTAASSGPNSGLYTSLVSKLQQLRTLQALETSNATVIPEILTPTKVRPKPTLDAVLGIVLGLVLGLAAAFALEGLDTRLRTVGEVERMFGAGAIGFIPRLSRRYGRGSMPPVMIADPDGKAAEAFRLLRAMFNLSVPSKPAAVMISSPDRGDGKTTVASNLGIALARAGKRVILVDADLRWPALAHRFNVEPSPGLVEVALELTTLRSVLRPIGLIDPSIQPSASNGSVDALHDAQNGDQYSSLLSTWSGGGSLYVVPGGRVSPGLSDFFALDQARRLVSQLKSLADFVIFDAPPILHVNDAIALGSLVDYQLFVVKLPSARRGTVKALRRAAERSPARTLGLVLNYAEATSGDAYGYDRQPDPGGYVAVSAG